MAGLDMAAAGRAAAESMEAIEDPAVQEALSLLAEAQVMATLALLRKGLKPEAVASYLGGQMAATQFTVLAPHATRDS